MNVKSQVLDACTVALLALGLWFSHGSNQARITHALQGMDPLWFNVTAAAALTLAVPRLMERLGFPLSDELGDEDNDK